MADYTDILRLGAGNIREHGWVQGTLKDKAGRVCLTGSLRPFCTPGDWRLLQAVLEHRERAEEWNDLPERTEAEVVEFLETAEITDADLAETFGPQWKEVRALVRRASALSADEEAQLSASWDTAGRTARRAARDAAWSAAGDASWRAYWYAARGAAVGATRALIVRDLIGQHGFTQEHYDTLTAPWAQVIGKVHPDD